MDTLIKARWIVPVEPDGEVLDHHSIAVNQGAIVEILDSARAAQKYRGDVIDLDDHVLIPGLINAHTHAAMSLFRGMADDMPLVAWLNDHIWPAENQWVSSQFVRVGTQLAVAEMLQSGTTCFSDMYFFPDVCAEVAEMAGIRACVGLILIDFPSAWANDTPQYIEKGLSLHDTLRHSALINTAFAPHAPYTVTDDTLAKVRTLADELDIPIHMHVHETAHEIETSTAQFNVRPLERLSRLGLANPRLIAVHMTQLLAAEIESVGEFGISVVHCPESNLKLASGMCPVQALLEAGVNVALGTDGPASNNDLDMLSEMRTAALLAKGVSGDPAALPAATALRMATLNGAKALGLDELTGSLLPGKAADIVAVDMSGLATRPVYDPVSQLVYSASRDHVTDVWVAGRRVLKARGLTTLDQDTLLDAVTEWSHRISSPNPTASKT